MQTTYKFRLYPTHEQEDKLQWVLDKCRYVYNILLSRLNDQKIIDKGQLQGDITDLRRIETELKDVYSKTLQYENCRLFSNLRALSQLKKNGKKVGRMRFKGKGWFKTFTYNQSGFKVIEREVRYDILYLSKIGNIPMVMYRKIQGKIKQVIVKHSASGKWYASIIAETKEEIKPTTNTKKVGIDLGLNSFTYDSDNNKFEHPRCLEKSSHKLSKERRRLSKMKKGSNNRKKQRTRVARIYEKIVNQRNDFLHKISRYYANNYGFVVIEKLQIRNMVRNKHLAKSILDASWSKFIQMLDYKVERTGGQVVKVNPKNTTQKCSHCKRIVKKSLSVRIHKCKCGFVVDRDYNAALNILKKGIGQELSEYTPMETEPMPIMVSSSVKQEVPRVSWE
ncbi:transposase [archaeon]|nr:transposase [archaeon]